MDTSYDTDTGTRGEKPWSVLQPRRRRNFNAVQFRANEREPLDDGAGEEYLDKYVLLHRSARLLQCYILIFNHLPF